MARAHRPASVPALVLAVDPNAPAPSARDVSALRRALGRWYAKNRRDLPWRRRPTPYRTWVSEIMLQQTRVDVVVPYFQRFMRRFPSVRALASAPLDHVLQAWSGLGYYRRARMLHEGAREVLEQHRGRFPRTMDEALAIPGVGRYTAGAILSIAYGVRAPIVDGNVIRVLARVFGIDGAPDAGPVRAEFWGIAARLADADDPGTINQSIMELGALVCLPRAPRCEVCPVSKLCVAKQRAIVDRLPRVTRSRESVDVTCHVLLVQRRDEVLLRVRGPREVSPGMWDLPGSFAGDNGDCGPTLEEARGSIPFAVGIGSHLGTIRHAVTYRNITLEVHGARPAGRTNATAKGAFRWVPAEVAPSLALSAPARRILASWGARLTLEKARR